MFRLLNLDHLVLRIVDLERMLRFYCDALGCAVERRQDGIGLVQLRAGDALIDLVPVNGKLGRAGGAAPGREGRNLDHFCLRVEPFDEQAIRARLARHGFEAGPVERRYGAEGDGPSIYVTDPEGNVVELKGPPESAPGVRAGANRPATGPRLRVARPTHRLAQLAAMYEAGLGLVRLGEFRDHDGFDGIMLGPPGADWHLEFTHEAGAAAAVPPGEEHLLVLYVADEDEWHATLGRMKTAGFTEVAPHNPYWKRRGATFADVDGYHVVIQNAAWSA